MSLVSIGRELQIKRRKNILGPILFCHLAVIYIRYTNNITMTVNNHYLYCQNKIVILYQKCLVKNAGDPSAPSLVIKSARHFNKLLKLKKKKHCL